MPQSLKEIKHSAMRDCEKLVKITIPENVTIIDSSAFLDCPAEIDRQGQ